MTRAEGRHAVLPKFHSIWGSTSWSSTSQIYSFLTGMNPATVIGATTITPRPPNTVPNRNTFNRNGAGGMCID